MAQVKRKPHHLSLGSVEGRLELVSLHPGRRRFNVCHALTGKTVRCSLPPELEEVAKGGLGKRVIVAGLVSYDEKGIPFSVQSERLRIVKEDRELPSVKDMVGLAPDITGELSTEEYIRTLRGG